MKSIFQTKRYMLAIVCLTGTLTGWAQILTLEECQQAAIERNRKLQNASLSYQMAIHDKREALTNYFPQVSATGFGFQGFHPLLQTDVALPGMESAIPFSMMKKGATTSVTAVQPLFAGGRIVTGNKLAGLQQEVSSLQLILTEDEVRLKTADYFWRIASLKGQLDVLKSVQNQLVEVYRQVELSVEAGITTRNDLLRVELRQQELESNVLKTENGIKISSMLLAQHIGLPTDSFDIHTAALFEPPAPSEFFVDPRTAAIARTEYQLSQVVVKAEKYNVKMERGKHLPTVGIGVGDVFYNLMDKNVNNGVVFASISIPISSWWGGSHSIKKAKLKLQQAQNNLAEAEEMLAIDVESSWYALLEAYAQIDIARKSVASATENLRLNRDFFAAGTSSLTDLLDAETLYTDAHSKLISTCAAYQTRLMEYLQKV